MEVTAVYCEWYVKGFKALFTPSWHNIRAGGICTRSYHCAAQPHRIAVYRSVVLWMHRRWSVYLRVSWYYLPSSQYQLRPEGGRGAEQITGAGLYFTHSCLSLQYHYLSIVQINPFRPRPSHSATESQSFRFSVKILSRSAVAARPEESFHQVSKPLAAAPVSMGTFPYTVGNIMKDTVFYKPTHSGYEKWTFLAVFQVHCSIEVVDCDPLCAEAEWGLFPYA
jgi:hypothetical protein